MSATRKSHGRLITFHPLQINISGWPAHGAGECRDLRLQLDDITLPSHLAPLTDFIKHNISRHGRPSRLTATQPFSLTGQFTSHLLQLSCSLNGDSFLWRVPGERGSGRLSYCNFSCSRFLADMLRACRSYLHVLVSADVREAIISPTSVRRRAWTLIFPFSLPIYLKRALI